MAEKTLKETRKELEQRCKECSGRGYVFQSTNENNQAYLTFTDFYGTRILKKCKCKGGRS